ncbi:cupin domain-containing protein [Pseudomonas fluorescens]|uniref:(S)-2-hydroxypropylphosphonic acid epoxidase n=1 Tax=Pseudomonas fluorescens TaxID=294 RepID=A0A5E7DLP6_PSEFL|nr:cupin domain-containing protein [Pseudomonas fluorescens]VVO18387.1 (S)-2-hydroxypropylphosphonic acid epoxidase [Pseudomonas fluorescens]VVQ22098.1 (S)-2-hydroxypropylphosphonic acid epoxidase [Pseudomonas fluorescens]
MSIKIGIAKIEELAASRKMSVDEVLRAINAVRTEYVVIDSMSELQKLADVLIIPMDEVLRGLRSDLTNGVKIFKRNEGFRKVSSRDGKKYYTYQHLATTNSAPELMALKVTLHCGSLEDVVLNEGHSSREVVYVLKGAVRVDWGDGVEAERQAEVLLEGDSIYISPNVPHSFMALEGSSEILAFNYSLP